MSIDPNLAGSLIMVYETMTRQDPNLSDQDRAILDAVAAHPFVVAYLAEKNKGMSPEDFIFSNLAEGRVELP